MGTLAIKAVATRDADRLRTVSVVIEGVEILCVREEDMTGRTMWRAHGASQSHERAEDAVHYALPRQPLYDAIRAPVNREVFEALQMSDDDLSLVELRAIRAALEALVARKAGNE